MKTWISPTGNDPYEVGKAHRSGGVIGYNQCPYKPDTPEAKDWQSGWKVRDGEIRRYESLDELDKLKHETGEL